MEAIAVALVVGVFALVNTLILRTQKVMLVEVAKVHKLVNDHSDKQIEKIDKQAGEIAYLVEEVVNLKADLAYLKR